MPRFAVAGPIREFVNREHEAKAVAADEADRAFDAIGLLRSWFEKRAAGAPERSWWVISRWVVRSTSTVR